VVVSVTVENYIFDFFLYVINTIGCIWMYIFSLVQVFGWPMAVNSTAYIM
jgi:hypothetical protein